MKLTKTNISGLTIIEPKVFYDSRGFYYESYNESNFDKYFGKINFIQDSESKSVKGVLRGFHFQRPPFDQSKLVRCVQGMVLDVVLDLRKKSSTFGKVESIILSSENKKQLYIPRGFAHAYLVLSDTAVFSYKIDNVYAPDYECGVIWNDPSLSIDWGINEVDLIISDKDKKLDLLSNIKSPF